MYLIRKNYDSLSTLSLAAAHNVFIVQRFERWRAINLLVLPCQRVCRNNFWTMWQVFVKFCVNLMSPNFITLIP